ncbi:AAA family ATPase [Paenibacillus hamazuiensis]|uniref:AAA family ATPase n=1 Tax=Paenibacillus hamazuiensis TaxID=2936508 RepID=UPI00200FE6EF|nr:SMC family ATPase [Paenibacillus hamazuiensis]
MKPISLQIAGLQSYREPQEIDFTKLCEAGVFGIFGPTGSGKSSILDAMTLALFGVVERAAGGTQGIMNQAENTLSVSFSFQLQNASGIDTYRVDRQFKRTGEVSVTGTVSRLVRMKDGETVVLADKAKDVTAQIQDILGLSMQDFTRAVVLPQGKFAEFLTLTGKDRRLMLQRLFHLESYGDQLSAKVSGKFKETDVAIKEIAATQTGLGEASDEALQAAQERLREAELRAKEIRGQLAAHEQKVEEIKQLKTWQTDRELTTEALERLEARTPQIEALKRRLAEAEQAERLRPYLEQAEYGERQVAAAEREEQLATRDHAAAAEQYAHAETAHVSAEQLLQASEAPLSVRISQLEQALQDERDIASLEAAMRELTVQAAAADTELQQAKEQLRKESELREKALKRQAELKEELKLAEVGAETRLRLQQAAQQLQELERLQTQLAEQDAELAKLRKQQSDASLAERELAAEAERAARGKSEWLGAALAAHAQAAAAAAGLERLVQAMPQLGRQLREAGREAELRRMAAELAERLRPGEPCPVCGSREHAMPAGPHDEGEPDAALDAQRELEAKQHEVRERLTAAQQLSFRLRGLLGQADAAASATDAAVAGAAGSAYLEVAAAASPSVTAALENILQQLVGISRELAAAAEWEKNAASEAASLEQRLKELQREEAALDGRLREARAAQQQLDVFLGGLAEKRSAAERTYQDKLRSWEISFPGLKREQLEQDVAGLQRKDEAAEELKQRIEKSVPFLEEREAAIQRLQQQSAALELALVERRTKLAADDARLREKERQLAALTGGERAEALVAAATRQLAELRASAAAAKTALEQARERLQAAAHRKAAAQQALASAAEHAAKAQGEWRQALAATAFADGQQVRSALLPAADKAAWAREAEAHDSELAQLRGKLRELEAKLQGRVVADDEWAALQERLAQLKQADEEALQSRAKAERDHEELLVKHEQWKRLEEARLGLQTLLDRLSKLQSVLRGNAFVEFVAEEQLMQVSRAASERLGSLTRGKYAIEVDSGGGFVIRDNAGGGVRRPVTTLSGGETFLTSLALALALSAQIQLKGQYPLEFFFLDEGFGTLDQELLETVIAALEKLHVDRLTVGVISHVPELKNRLPRRLTVEPAEPGGRGSRVKIETF